MEKRVAGAGHAATDHDALNAKCQHERAQCPGEMHSDLSGDLLRDQVLLGRGAEDVSGGCVARERRRSVGGYFFACRTCDGGARGHGFEAAD